MAFRRLPRRSSRKRTKTGSIPNPKPPCSFVGTLRAALPFPVHSAISPPTCPPKPGHAAAFSVTVQIENLKSQIENEDHSAFCTPWHGYGSCRGRLHSALCSPRPLLLTPQNLPRSGISVSPGATGGLPASALFAAPLGSPAGLPAARRQRLTVGGTPTIISPPACFAAPCPGVVEDEDGPPAFQGVSPRAQSRGLAVQTVPLATA